jgi:hypothetical protein
MRRTPAVRNSLLLIGVAFATPALAAQPSATSSARPSTDGAAAPPPAPTALSGVVVTPRAKQPPSIISTYPAQGAVVMPGALILKLTFDQKMNPDDWRFDRAEGKYPACLDRPRLLPNEKTFVLLCTVGGAGKFSIQMNGPGPGGFANLADQRADPLVLEFSTQDGASVSTIKDAIKSAGLKDEDDPVMDSRPAASKRQASAAAKPAPE